MALDMLAISLALCGFLPDDVSGLKGMTLGCVQVSLASEGKGAWTFVLAGGMGSGGSSSSKQNEPCVDVQYSTISAVSILVVAVALLWLLQLSSSGQRGVAARAKRGHQASAAPPATSP